MKMVLTVVGKTTDKHFEAGILEYISRINHYVPFSLEVVPELKSTKSLSESQQKDMEASLIRKTLQHGDYLVLLDERGVERRSVDFAKWMERKMVRGLRRMVFLVGGPYGFSDEIYDIADEKISLSQMTLSHQMIRLLFTEQVYRAMTIINNEPYHHE